MTNPDLQETVETLRARAVGWANSYNRPDRDRLRLAKALIDDCLTLLKAQQWISELAFKAYYLGYEKGHNDTVESGYYPPIEYPEEWSEIYAELLEDFDLPAPPQEEG